MVRIRGVRVSATTHEERAALSIALLVVSRARLCRLAARVLAGRLHRGVRAVVRARVRELRVRALTSPWSRVTRAIWRWANLLLLAVLGAIVFEAIVPFAWAVVRVRALSLSPPFIVVVVLLTTSLLAYVIAEPVRI